MVLASSLSPSFPKTVFILFLRGGETEVSRFGAASLERLDATTTPAELAVLDAVGRRVAGELTSRVRTVAGGDKPYDR